MLCNDCHKKFIKSKYKLGALSVTLASMVPISCHDSLQDKTNIIIIMADDLGYGDIGCYGNKNIRTPALDQMAIEGMRFINYFSNGAVSTPTRASLLTGCYPQRIGLEGVLYAAPDKRHDGGILSEAKTIAELFKENGYMTGIFGKWHLGYDPEYNPVMHGFDEFYGYVSGNVDYISHRDGISLYDWWHNTDSIYEEGYVTDLITDHAVDFMERNKDKPFLLYLPHEAVHAPYQGRTDLAVRVPGQKEIQVSQPDKKRAYKEMLEIMDENISRIFKKLKELGLDKNTFVLFCSDNGAVNLGSNGILNGFKTTLWEGGIHVPAIAWYPNKIKPGIISKSKIISMDVMPTVLSIAGIETDIEFDGEDFSEVLFNNGEMQERLLFWRYRNQWAVMKGDWKYLKINYEEYLFNLKNDISETINLKDRFPEEMEMLKSELVKWETEMSEYQLQVKD